MGPAPSSIARWVVLPSNVLLSEKSDWDFFVLDFFCLLFCVMTDFLVACRHLFSARFHTLLVQILQIEQGETRMQAVQDKQEG